MRSLIKKLRGKELEVLNQVLGFSKKLNLSFSFFISSLIKQETDDIFLVKSHFSDVH